MCQLKCRWMNESVKSISLININVAASLVDKSLDGPWVSLFVMFAHYIIYADITKIHKAIFPFGSDVGLMPPYNQSRY